MFELIRLLVVLLSFIVVPGFLICRAFGTRGVWSALLSPVVGLAFLTCICQVYALVGIVASPMGVFTPAILISLVLMLLLSRRFSSLDLPRIHPVIPVLYVLIGLALGYNLFIFRIGSLDALYQAYDVTWHLNVIQGFVDSGKFTCFGVSPYLSAADAAIAPVDYSGFYPTAWHMLCALTSMATGASVPTVINVSMLAFAGVVFPLAVLAFLASLFPNNKRILLCGAIVCVAFVAFPWYLLVFGPVYPNFAGFCLVPAAMATFVRLTRPEANVSERVRLGVLLVGEALGLALCHPNAVFTCVLLLSSYCVHRLYDEAAKRTANRVIRFAVPLVFIVFVAAFWLFCYKLPFLQDTVTHTWKPYAWAWQEIINILTLQYTFGFCYETASQYVLGALVVFGAVGALFKSGKRWMTVSYSLACYVLLVAATHKDEFKQILAGFWYTDPMRLGAVCTIAAIPLAALGLEWVYCQVVRACEKYNAVKTKPTNCRLIAASLAVAFLVLNFMPGFNLAGLHRTYTQEEYRKYYKMEDRDRPNKSFHTTYGDFREIVSDTYRLDNPLDSTEQVFLDKVQQIVPKDAVIINDPMDGSFLAYGTRGMRVYYRNFVGFGGSNEASASKTIRTSLVDYDSNEEVKSAVDSIDALYVMVLRGKECEASFINLRKDYDASLFTGITSITESTPGFKLLLKTGPMALYEIER